MKGKWAGLGGFHALTYDDASGIPLSFSLLPLSIFFILQKRRACMPSIGALDNTY